ncbi:MAG: AAA family ATPase [Actinomycetota bacterium]|nr:AAA family ATPase [Actinomycetota bacterium]
MACPSCHRPVPDGASFCPACGHALGSTGSEERRVVTVLFADLVGYTSLAEQMDPEQVKRMVDQCFARLVADVEVFGGRVDKLLGDAVVALFGAPVAHEDDAERAVRAALRMQSHLLEPFQMRVGVNTGEVVVGTLSGTDYTAMGDVVNTAARLQALADPGTVLVGDATAALLSAAITREPYGVTQLRGRSRAEAVWRVTGTVLPTPAKPSRQAVPFVGRVHQCQMLHAVTELVVAGRSAIVSVVGEPGIGKTRFVEEAIVTARAEHPEIALRRGACAPYDETNIWSPIARAAADAADIDPHVSPDAIRKMALEHATALWGMERDEPELTAAVEAFLHMLGHPSALDRLDPHAARDEVVRNIAAELSRHARSHPVILWIDDVQWADPILLDALRVAAQSLADLPLLIITAHRPDRDVIWPPLLERALLLRLPLGPLTREAALELSVSILGGDLDEEAAERLYDRSGGSPLFLTELGAMTSSDDGTAAMPGSLRALIAARLDGLPPSQRAIIDNAAVLGVSGTEAGLYRFAREMGQQFSPADLSELIADGFLELDGNRWRFRSDVVRDVAYETLTKQVRAQRHAGVASVMQKEPRLTLDERAHHLATAAELVVEMGPIPGVPGSIGEQAVSTLGEAARRSLETGSFGHAERQATRALDLQQAGPEIERELQIARATAFAESHRLPEAYADASTVLAAAVEDGDRVNEGEARRLIGTIAQQQGDLPTARAELERSVELFRELGDDGRLAESLLARGFAEVFGGSLAVAERVLGEADELYRSRSDDRGSAWVGQHLAWVSFLSGDHAEADRRLVSAVETFEQLGDRSGVSWAHGLLAWVRYFQRRFDDAEQLAEEVRLEVRGWGDRWASMMMQTLLANVRLWTGRVAEAEPIAERAVSGFRKLKDPFGTIQAMAPLNRIRIALGKTADAERGVEESLSLAESVGDGGLALQAAVGVAMHVGDPAKALTLADRALDQRRRTGADASEVLVMQSLAQCQSGAADEALATLEGLDVAGLPFGRSVQALARALTGDASGAAEDAAAVRKLQGPSYFDTSIAVLAAAGAAAMDGDETSVGRSLTELGELADEVGDVVMLGLARYARLQMSAESDDDRPAKAGISLGDGWRQVVDDLVALSERVS